MMLTIYIYIYESWEGLVVFKILQNDATKVVNDLHTRPFWEHFPEFQIPFLTNTIMEAYVGTSHLPGKRK